jgi:DNA-binding SARP family transcriptional activator
VLTIQLLGRFAVTTERGSLELPNGSARVLAFLGLHDSPQKRTRVATQLWPNVDIGRALGNLRSALWRVTGSTASIIQPDGDFLSLPPDATCDVALLRQASLEPPPPLDPADARKLCAALLPGWYDDWVVIERERLAWRQAHRLETFSIRCFDERRFADAVLYAAASIRIEPLRESAHRALIQAHGALGNSLEVRTHVAFLRNMFQAELGVCLSRETERLAVFWLRDGDGA